jgi:hypothetical protein
MIGKSPMAASLNEPTATSAGRSASLPAPECPVPNVTSWHSVASPRWTSAGQQPMQAKTREPATDRHVWRVATVR